MAGPSSNVFDECNHRPPPLPPTSSSTSSSSSTHRRHQSYTVRDVIKVFLLLPLSLLWLTNHGVILISSRADTRSPPNSIVPSHRVDAPLSPPHDVSSGRSDISSTTFVIPTPPPPVIVAYAISLIKCSDKQSSTSGLIDAATVLRHSIHRNSVRNPTSGSRYDYALYAIVHSRLASQCSGILGDLGYEVLLRDTPVKISEIRGEYLRKNVHKEWCCGADEFVKLYAYTIAEHPIVVHTDIDFMYHRPMDDVYDAMIYPSTSDLGKAARSRIEMEYPNTRDDMPTNIEAYLTRDYHQVIPGRKAAFQAGFIVLRPNLLVFERYLDIIREGNYVGGYARDNGWGGMGYGGVVGSMAMQGLPAYFYDVVRPNTTVELNGCRYNHMGANVYYDDVPNFIMKYRDLHGKCRRNLEGCEDCRRTDLDSIKNMHFTNCRKPWNCAGRSSTGKGDIDPRTADYDHCMQVAHAWHEMRTDLEQSIFNITGGDTKILDGQAGSYKKEIFMGHCSKDGQDGYRPIQASKEVMEMVAAKLWN